MGTARLAFWSTIALAIGQALYYTPKLPERVATHFGVRGEPDGWQSPEGFLIFTLIMVAVMAITFGAVPWLMRRGPDALINVPHRAYYLAPERRDETIDTVVTMMWWIGALTMVFLIVVMQQVINANLSPPARLGSAFTSLLIGYLALVGVAVFRLHRRFKKPDSPG